MRSRILVTGASGFIGRRLCQELRLAHDVTGGLRSHRALPGIETFTHGFIDSKTDWTVALRDVDTVFHLAARVHELRDQAANPLEEFLKVNADATENLAVQAARQGVRRLVFLSTIGVHGDRSFAEPIHEGSPISPRNDYSRSKWEAEKRLETISKREGIEVVILRAPLVYGPDPVGNFATLLRWVSKRVPLPLALVDNRRSLIGLGNLVNILTLCIEKPGIAGETFVLSDGEDLSTARLIRLLGDALGKPARLFPCPGPILKLVARVTGKTRQLEQLSGNLVLDNSKLRRTFDWKAPFSVKDEIGITATHYLAAQSRRSA